MESQWRHPLFCGKQFRNLQAGIAFDTAVAIFVFWCQKQTYLNERMKLVRIHLATSLSWLDQTENVSTCYVCNLQITRSPALKHDLSCRLFHSKWYHNLENEHHAALKKKAGICSRVIFFISYHTDGTSICNRWNHTKNAGSRHYCIGFTFQTSRLCSLIILSMMDVDKMS